jgi:site-specific DNA-methyltransferase (adenine-specific)/adenine-specific DNA-methyltransferase
MKNLSKRAYANQIIVGDCLAEMLRLPADCSQLIIADPPYNLNKDFGLWKESKRRQSWLPWCKEWLAECKRILSPGGNLFVYGIHHHLCWVQCALYDLGLQYRRQIIWNYDNGFAGYSTRSLAARYEPILWFSKGDGYTYHTIREPYKSVERLKHKITKNGKTWTPHPEGRMLGDIWTFPTLAGRRFRDEKVNHPTQKPLSLTIRIVEHFSNPGELVVVPFAGSGTECLAAAMLNRDYWGVELNPAYVQIAQSRIDKLNCTEKKPPLFE